MPSDDGTIPLHAGLSLITTIPLEPELAVAEVPLELAAVELVPELPVEVLPEVPAPLPDVDDALELAPVEPEIVELAAAPLEDAPSEVSVVPVAPPVVPAPDELGVVPQAATHTTAKAMADLFMKIPRIG